MRPTTRPLRPAYAAALAAAALTLSACGSSGGSSDASSGPSASGSATAAATTQPVPSPAATGDLADVVVGGTDAKPTVALKGGKLVTDKTVVKVLKPGTGEVVKNGATLVTKLILVKGLDGKTVLDSYSSAGTQMVTVGNVLPGLQNAIVGQKIGTRLLAAVPAKDGFLNGQPQLNIQKGETVVFYIEIVGKPQAPLKSATGAVVAPKPGMPTVAFKNDMPTITVPKMPAPTKLDSANLINGAGAVVAKGQTITVNYQGVLWATGAEFDSSFKRKEPASFPIGVGQVIPAWDKTLVGQKVGSRVLIVAPPADGYGAAGKPPSIPANSTLVFVVDILAAS